MNDPTPYPEVNDLVRTLLEKAQTILGDQFVGMYLEGSLANGDFDRDSDIDFVVVTDEDVSGDLFTTLQAMHDRLATIDSWWAIQLEGSYMAQHALLQYDPAHTSYPNIERGRGERLKMVDHDDAWTTHRYVLRERGIVIVGPPLQTLIDPVSPDDLRRAMLTVLNGWAILILNNPREIESRAYQSYTVLSVCRILYTCQWGDVVSKLCAARWAKEALDERWAPLIDRAWEGRRGPQGQAQAEDVNETLAFLRYARERSQPVETSRAAVQD